MGNACCGSGKKNQTNFNGDALNESDGTEKGDDIFASSGNISYGDGRELSGGGITGQTAKINHDLDALMDEYIEENLEQKDIRDATGLITFEYFLKIYKAALIWNRVNFQETKNAIILRRRKALKDRRLETYRQCIIDISNEDEKCLQLVLEEILDKIKIDNKEF